MKRLREFVHSFRCWVSNESPEALQYALAFSALAALVFCVFLICAGLATALLALGMAKDAAALTAGFAVLVVMPWAVALLRYFLRKDKE